MCINYAVRCKYSHLSRKGNLSFHCSLKQTQARDLDYSNKTVSSSYTYILDTCLPLVKTHMPVSNKFRIKIKIPVDYFSFFYPRSIASRLIYQTLIHQSDQLTIRLNWPAFIFSFWENIMSRNIRFVSDSASCCYRWG